MIPLNLKTIWIFINWVSSSYSIDYIWTRINTLWGK